MLYKNKIPLALTLIRLTGVFPLFFLIYYPPFSSHYAAMIFFIALSLTDALDGYLARKWKCESFLGVLIDPIADKVLVLGSLMILIDIGRIHVLIGILFLAREFLITASRVIASQKNISIQADPLGKWKTGFQMTGISMLILFNPSSFFNLPIDHIGTVILIIGLILSWVSGYKYLKKYQIISF